MTFFPLYDNLMGSKVKKALSKDEKVVLIESISKLDQDGQNKVLAIILYYQKENNLPYSEPDATMTVNLSTLPAELQVIIELFCSMHLSFMKDSANRESVFTLINEN